MRSGAVCFPSKRFVGRGCQTRPALACHKYAGSLRINTTIFRSRAASPLAALLPYYNQAPSYGRGLEDKFILKTGSSLFPKICRSYFLFTPHGLGDFLDQFELVPLFRSVSLLPISQEAKPHCGLRQRRSSGIYFSASWMRAITKHFPTLTVRLCLTTRRIIVDCQIAYENGARVETSFVTSYSGGIVA